MLARIPNLAVQNMFVGVVSYLGGRGRQKHVFWDVATIFCFTELHFNSVIFKHSVFSKG